MSTPLPGTGNLSANFHLIVATLLLCCSFVFADEKIGSFDFPPCGPPPGEVVWRTKSEQTDEGVK